MRHLGHLRGGPMFSLSSRALVRPVTISAVYFGHHPNIDSDTKNKIQKLREQLGSRSRDQTTSTQEVYVPDDLPPEQPELKGMQDKLLFSKTIVLFIDLDYLQDCHSTLEFRMAFNLWWTNLDRHLLLVCLEHHRLLCQARNVDSDIICLMSWT